MPSIFCDFFFFLIAGKSGDRKRLGALQRTCINYPPICINAPVYFSVYVLCIGVFYGFQCSPKIFVNVAQIGFKQ